MTHTIAVSTPARNASWLQRYYFTRAAFSATWIIVVLMIAHRSAIASAVLLILYPLWDAAANLVDARRSGGLANNRTQLFNVVVSVVVAAALGAAWPDMNKVLTVFGAWAILSGLLQLGTAVRRWKTSGAQWAMILSGAQSALAGAFFISKARLPVEPSIAILAGYAGFGAFYFLVSALMLTLAAWRGKGRTT